LVVVGWQAALAGGGFLCGALIQGLVLMGNPNYVPKPYQETLLFWATILFAVLINTVISRALPKIEGLILIFHVLGFFAILVPLVYMAPHGSASTVFTTFLNEGAWPTQGLSFMVGLVGPIFNFLGICSPDHAENID
jgi:choline transport protein